MLLRKHETDSYLFYDILTDLQTCNFFSAYIWELWKVSTFMFLVLVECSVSSIPVSKVKFKKVLKYYFS